MTAGDTSGQRTELTVPTYVLDLCATLQTSGFEAVVVGGAVRDALLYKTAFDWDVATSATPDQMIKALKGYATIPTGIEHGTLTVMCKTPSGSKPVELTTFRGEGEYLDARRPSSVVLGVPLREDLARRDITINAIAYDPIARILFDPFNGQGDIAARMIKCVGDPVARLTEDGLRVMRVVRFAAQLGFSIDTATEVALTAALPSLSKVAVERIWVEWWKLLGAPAIAPTLALMSRSGITAAVLSDLGNIEPMQAVDTLANSLSGDDLKLARFSLLLSKHHDAGELARAMCIRLKTSAEIRDNVSRLAMSVTTAPTDEAMEHQTIVTWLAAVPRKLHPTLFAALQAEGRSATIAQGISEQQRVPLAIGELPVVGEDLMKLQDPPLAPGRWLGQCLRELLQWSWAPERQQGVSKDECLQFASQWIVANRVGNR